MKDLPLVGAPHAAGASRSPNRATWKQIASRLPVRSLWDLKGVPVRVIAARTWKSLLADRLFRHAAELGFYFLFALFPALVSASSILGLAARSANHIYDHLLDYLALVIPGGALGTIVATFNETTAASSPGKFTLGLATAIWSASVGISAVQDTLNDVYKIQDSRSYLMARMQAIGLTLVLSVVMTLGLTALLGGSFAAAQAHKHIGDPVLEAGAAWLVRFAGWVLAMTSLTLTFAFIYFWAPDRKPRRWHWLTPGTAAGICGWLLTSLGFRLYLHYHNTYSLIYGSLGAVIILLMWFYLTGLMLLVGAEIDSEIEAAAAERLRQ